MGEKILIGIFATLLLIIVFGTCADYVRRTETDSDRTASSAGTGDKATPTPTPDEESPFRAVAMKKIGKHTYYSDDLFEKRHYSDEIVDKVMSIMLEADESLDADVYVSFFNTMYNSEDFHMFAKRLTNGVLENAVDYVAGRQAASGKVFWGRKDLTVTVQPFDLSNVRPAKEFFDSVYDLAKENESEIFRFREKEPIGGEYMLKVLADGTLYYEFQINLNSTVRVDAGTGKILLQNFWSGVYED